MRIIDLSHWNKVRDWGKLKKDFIIQKCTQGTSYLDPTYKERRDKIQASYHFADGKDPIKEADWYIKNQHEKMLILDWEIEHIDPAWWCGEFIDRVKKKTGKDCWLYTNDARALKHTFPNRWKKWIARYKDYSGTLDYNYHPKSDWDMWQYTSRGKVDGIDGNVDLSVSRIDLSEAPPTPTPTEPENPVIDAPSTPEPMQPIETPMQPEKEQLNANPDWIDKLIQLIINLIKKIWNK